MVSNLNICSNEWTPKAGNASALVIDVCISRYADFIQSSEPCRRPVKSSRPLTDSVMDAPWAPRRHTHTLPPTHTTPPSARRLSPFQCAHPNMQKNKSLPGGVRLHLEVNPTPHPLPAGTKTGCGGWAGQRGQQRGIKGVGASEGARLTAFPCWLSPLKPTTRTSRSWKAERRKKHVHPCSRLQANSQMIICTQIIVLH